MTRLVVDLSNNNQATTIADIKATLEAQGDTLGAVILKATEGVSYVDSWFSHYVAQANALGVPWLAYHCIRLESGPALQAGWATDVGLGLYSGCSGFMLDWEPFGPLGTIATTAQVLKFMSVMDSLTVLPRFLYAAGWIDGKPDVYFDQALTRWPYISPDSETHVLGVPCLHQNPNGYLMVNGKYIDIDYPTSTLFFDLILGKGITMTLEAHIIIPRTNAGQDMATRYVGITTPEGVLLMTWWIKDEALVDLFRRLGVTDWSNHPVVASFSNVVLLGDVPVGDPLYAWQATDYLYQLSSGPGSNVAALVGQLAAMGVRLDTLDAGVRGLTNVTDDHTNKLSRVRGALA